MSDTKELIERLRGVAQTQEYAITDNALFEAADALEAQAATIASLEAERDAARLLFARVLAADDGEQILGRELAAAIRAAMRGER